MKRPLLFAAEAVAGILLAAAGSWVAGRLNAKANRATQAEERLATAAETIAHQLTQRDGRPAEPRRIYAVTPVPPPRPEPDPCNSFVTDLDQAACTTGRAEQFIRDLSLSTLGGASRE